MPKRWRGKLDEYCKITIIFITILIANKSHRPAHFPITMPRESKPAPRLSVSFQKSRGVDAPASPTCHPLSSATDNTRTASANIDPLISCRLPSSSESMSCPCTSSSCFAASGENDFCWCFPSLQSSTAGSMEQTSYAPVFLETLRKYSST